MAEFTLRGKRVSVHADGAIFVDGKATNLKQWQNGTQYSNQWGNEQTDLRGKSLEDALYIKGFLPRRGYSTNKRTWRAFGSPFFFSKFYKLSNLHIVSELKYISKLGVLQK